MQLEEGTATETSRNLRHALLHEVAALARLGLVRSSPMVVGGGDPRAGQPPCTTFLLNPANGDALTAYDDAKFDLGEKAGGACVLLELGVSG